MSTPTATSLIDEVDDLDEVVGTVERGDALRLGVNFRTAHVFVLNSHGELLLQRLAPSRERHPGRWGSSAAAYVFAGESYEAAARRRIAQELRVAPELREVAKIAMQDERSTKFVTLFVGRSDGFEIGEPEHIATARFWRRDEVRSALATEPRAFTPTFRLLFETFLGARSGALV